MIIDKDLLRQAGFTVDESSNVIRIYSEVNDNSRLAIHLNENLNLPVNVRTTLIDDFITRVNNAEIMEVINQCTE